MNDNIYGQGIDNHLMGLRYVAKEAGEPMPELFTDEAYAIVNHFALSTSQVSDQGRSDSRAFCIRHRRRSRKIHDTFAVQLISRCLYIAHILQIIYYN